MPPQLMRVALNSPHDHAHRDHTHLHGHAPKNFGFAFAAGTLLNSGLVAAQFLYGIHAHSMALIADAGHNLGDALGLLIAWGAYNLARWEPTDRYTYGFRSASILAALANAAILLMVTGTIVWEAVRRFAEPPPVAAPTVMVVAAIAIAGVSSVHDLHVWAMSTTETALTCHRVMPQGAPEDEFLHQVCEELDARFQIAHPTIQIEMGDQGCEPSALDLVNFERHTGRSLGLGTISIGS
jgi:Co/Zn/Cd efflux system component